jgi:hypothetical protein
MTRLSYVMTTIFILVFGFNVFAAGDRNMSLTGNWSFQLDLKGVGENERWYEKALAETVRLPGSTDENCVGNLHTGNDKYNYLSRVYRYEGKAWYQKEVKIPRTWDNRRIILFLERCHWQTQVWVDGHLMGSRDSLCVPHEYDLTTKLTPGEHKITICVDNTPKHHLGDFASSISENTQTNWNGIIGRIELRTSDKVWIDDVQIFPDIQKKEAEIRLTIGNVTGKAVNGKLKIQASCKKGKDIEKQEFGFTAESKKGDLTVRLVMGEDVQLWDEFSPILYQLKIALEGKGISDGYSDQYETAFGMRNFSVKDKQFILNGKNIFLRGTLECCIFPLTGYPPTDEKTWLRIYEICKSYGLNHMRFHSWCPPEAAFSAADKAGIFIQVEAPRANVGNDAGRDKFIEEEMLRILAAYGNHPSFILMCMGNELGGDFAVIESLVKQARQTDFRHLYSCSTASILMPADEYYVTNVTQYGPTRGIRGPFTDWNYQESVEKMNVPVVVHEVGQHSVYPSMNEIRKYTGVVRARNFEIIRDDLKRKNLLYLADEFTNLTGKHSALLYKEEIEGMLRTPGFAGLQLLDLHDYPGTGTALVGVLDAFWDSKGVITAKEFRQFCGQTVPLLRMKKRIFLSDETFTADAEIAHYGRSRISDVEPGWKITDEEGNKVASGTFEALSIDTGRLTSLGKVGTDLSKVTKASKLTITLSIKGTEICNSWDFWVYPAKQAVEIPDDVFVSTVFDTKTISALRSGKKVLLLAGSDILKDCVPGRFLPPFWNPVWFPNENVNMSILCDPKHHIFSDFPTDAHTNWQWYDLLQNSNSIILDDMPAEFRPVVQLIDNFTRNHKLGNIIEAKAGEGKLLICSIDLETNLDKRPAARQLKYSLLKYMQSVHFNPKDRLDIKTLKTIFKEPSFLARLDAEVIIVDSQHPGYEGAKAIDGKADTMWSTQWEPASIAYPHELVLDMKKEISVPGLRLLPRQDGIRNGWIKDIEIYCSKDGKEWGTMFNKSTLSNDGRWKIVTFSKTVTTRYIKVKALTPQDAKHPWATLAELDLLTEE